LLFVKIVNKKAQVSSRRELTQNSTSIFSFKSFWPNQLRKI